MFLLWSQKLLARLSKPFTIFCCVLIFVIIVALTLLAVVQLSQIVGDTIEDAIDSIQQTHDISIRYSSISIIPPLRVVVRDIEFGVGGTRVAQTDSIVISANPLKLLFNPSVAVVRQIHVRRADVLLNQQLLDLVANSNTSASTADGSATTPEHDSTGGDGIENGAQQQSIDSVQLEQLSSLIDEVLVQLTQNNSTLKVSQSKVAIEGVQSTIQIGSIDVYTRSPPQLGATDIGISATYTIQPYVETQPQSPLDMFAQRGTIVCTGSIVAAGSHPVASLEMAVQAPRFNTVDLKPLLLNIDYRAGVAKISSHNETDEPMLRGTFDVHTGIAVADININAITVEDLVSVAPTTTNISTVYQQLLTTAISTNIHATYNVIGKNLSYDGMIQITNNNAVEETASNGSGTTATNRTAVSSDTITVNSTSNGVDIKFYGDERRSTIDTSVTQAGVQRVDGMIAVDIANRNATGQIILRRLSIAPSIALNGTIDIIKNGLNNTILSGDSLSVGGLLLPHLQSSVRFTDDFVHAQLNIGFDADNSPQISVISYLNSNRTQGLDVTLIAQDVMVNEISSALTNQSQRQSQSQQLQSPQQTNAAQLGISSSIRAKVVSNNVDFVINNLDVFDHATDQYVFQMKAAGNNQQIAIDTFVVSVSGQPIVNQVIDIEAISSGAYRIVLNDKANNAHLPTILEYRHGRFLRVQSSPFVKGVIVFNTTTTARYFVSITDHTVALNSLLATYSLTSSGYFNSTTDWRVHNSSFSIALSQITTPQYTSENPNYQTRQIGTVSTGLNASPRAVDITQLEWSSDGGIMVGNAQAAITQESISLTLDMASVNGLDSVSAQAEIPRDAPHLAVGELNIEELSVYHFIGKHPNLSGAINATATFSGNENNGYEVSGSLSTVDAVLGIFPFSFASEIHANTNAIIIDDLDVQMIGFEIADAVAEYNIIDQSFSLAAFVDQQYRQSIIVVDPVVVASPHPLIQGTLNVNGAVSSDPTKPNQPPALSYAHLQFEHTDALLFAPLSIRADYDSGTDSYVITDQVNQALTGTLSSSTLDIRAEAPFPIEFDAQGTIGAPGVNLSIKDIYLDVSASPRLVDLGFIRFIEGEITGALRMTSREQQPGVKMYGVLSISDVSMDVSYIPYRVGALSGDIVLEDNAIYLRRLYAPVEEEWGAYLALTFVFEQGLLNQFIVDIETLDSVPIPARYDFGGIGFDVLVSGAITLVGGNGALRLIKGDLVAENGSVVVRRSQSSEQQIANQSQFEMDLSISTGSQVEMLWPTQQLPIIRAIADFDQSIQVTIPPQSSEVFIDGDIAFRGGEIFYFERNFLIGEGSVTMNRVDGQIDPIMNLRAELREFTDRGPVNIYLLIENNFLSQLQPRLESTPALSQGEIARVMGNIIINPTASGSINEAQVALAFAGDFLARITVLRDFESALQTALNLFDIVTVRTEVFQNVLFDLVEFDTAVIPTEQLSINRYLDNTSLYLGKYIAERLFFQVELGLTADSNLPTINVATDDLVLDTTVSFELQSPLGLVSWNIAPNFSDSLSLNNTVDVEWSYVY